MSRPPAVVSVRREVPIPAEDAFRALTDWEAQGSWMPATRVRVDDAGTRPGSPVGLRIAAFSGWGRIGFLDTMHVVTWDPPYHCEVLHTGALVKGPGYFRVEPRGPRRCVVAWEEELTLPLGGLGRAGWVLLRRPVHVFFALALRRFAHFAVERAAGAGRGTADPGRD